jgi:hypothetical protein
MFTKEVYSSYSDAYSFFCLLWRPFGTLCFLAKRMLSTYLGSSCGREAGGGLEAQHDSNDTGARRARRRGGAGARGAAPAGEARSEGGGAATYAGELDELGARRLLDPVAVMLVGLVARGVVLLLDHGF